MRIASSLIALLLLAGCSTGGGEAVPLAMSEGAAGPRGFVTTAAVLQELLPHTFRDVEWGPMHVRQVDGSIDAAAALPNGKQAVVSATPDPDAPGSMVVRVKVGRFGDAKAEQRFLDALRKRLDKHAARHR